MTIRLEQLVAYALLTGLLLAVFAILKPFLLPLIWSGLLVYVTWPLHLWTLHAVKGRRRLAATLSTLALVMALLLPLMWFVWALETELLPVVLSLAGQLKQGSVSAPAILEKIPLVGDKLYSGFTYLLSAPTTLIPELKARSGGLLSTSGKLLGGVGHNLVRFLITLVTAFFLYLHGAKLEGQLTSLLKRLLGSSAERHLTQAGATTRAVVYGMAAAAITQGLLVWPAYVLAGVKDASFFALLTGSVALVPFGTFVIWGALALWLLAQGHSFAAISLIAWGLLVTNVVDSFLRPLIISNHAELPFLAVLFGALGGLAAFGIVGLFLGPVVLSTALGLWQDWINQS